MRSCKIVLAVAAVVLVPGVAPEVRAHSRYVGEIPNGAVFTCLNCHVSAGGGSRNAFGLAFAANGDLWGTALAGQDSDGDGWSNGAELLDPNGVWRPGQPDPGDSALVANPGSSLSTPVAVAAVTWSAIKSLYRHS